MQNECKKQRYVTLVMMTEPEKNQLKSIILNLKETCVSLTLVKITHLEVATVNNEKSIDLSLGSLMTNVITFDLLLTYAKSADLNEYKEYLRDRSQTPRSLIIFSLGTRQDTLHLLYKLQTERNIHIILVLDNFFFI